MKKAGLFIIALLILPLILQLVLQLTIVKSQEEIPGLPSSLQPGKIEETGEKIQEIEEKLTDKELRNNYLKQEWDKILLENKYVGSAYSFIKKALVFLNPFFKAVLGMEYSFSWAFFLALLIFVAFFIIVYSPLKNYIFIKHKIFGVIAGLVVAVLMAQLGVMKRIIDLLSLILKNIYYTIIFIPLIILLLLIYSLINKKFGEKLKAEMKKAAEERRERKAKAVEKKHNIELKEMGIKKP